MLFVGGRDGSIAVFNINVSPIVFMGNLGVKDEWWSENEGHTGGVTCLTIHDGKLHSGSYDNSVKVWNCSDHKLITTLNGHKKTVRCLTVHNGHLISGSYDSISIWSCEDYNVVATMTGPERYMHSLTAHDGFLYGAGNDLISMWDLKTYQRIDVAKLKNTEIVSGLAVHDGHLLSVHEGGTIKVFECEAVPLSPEHGDPSYQKLDVVSMRARVLARKSADVGLNPGRKVLMSEEEIMQKTVKSDLKEPYNNIVR
jgi:WD40 repeat protein